MGLFLKTSTTPIRDAKLSPTITGARLRGEDFSFFSQEPRPSCLRKSFHFPPVASSLDCFLEDSAGLWIIGIILNPQDCDSQFRIICNCSKIQYF